jgi:dinuclear metal center YbgI/SA1388 family protein
MITLQQFCHALDTELKIGEFSDYCQNGLQVEGRGEVRRAAFAVSCTLQTIEQALLWKADALVCHHALFWQKDPLVIRGNKRAKLKKILENELSFLAYHLPLDAHPILGNNWKAAMDLGWSHLSPFGIGVMGEVKPCEPEEFKTALQRFYKHEAVFAPGGGKIQKVALVSGGAYKMLEEAKEAGADAFITGSFDEPAWYLAKELGIHFFALGHSATEVIGPKALAKWTENTLKIKTTFLEIENPF